MQKEKILQRSLFIAVAAVGLTMAPTAVKAVDEAPATTPTPTPSDGKFSDAGLGPATVDGTTGVLTVSAANGAKEILVGTGKANVKKKTITVSNWDIYEPASDGSVKVDLSKLKNTVDNYLVLGTNTTNNVSIVKIPIAAKITKVKFDAKKAVLQAGYGANSSEAALKDLTVDTGAVFEYRTAYSDWTDMVSNSKLPDFSFYQQNGSQLYVRLKGDDGKGEGGNVDELKQDNDEKLSYNGQSEIPVYVAPHLPGKEVKVTIAAMAKGPSLTADFTNGTVKIPKNTEYRLVTDKTNTIYAGGAAPAPAASGSDTTTSSPAPVAYVKTLSDGKAHSVTDILTQAGATDEAIQTAALEVRKTETDKKPASKWNRLMIQRQLPLEGQITVGGTIDVTAKPSGVPPQNPTQKYDGGGINKAEVHEDGKNVFTIEYATTGSKTKTNIIKITNIGKCSYELRVGGKDLEAAPTEGKVTKIAAATTRAKTVTLKNVNDYSSIWIRRSGDKKTKNWATLWAKLGIVDYPYEVSPVTPAPSPSPTPGT